MPIYRNLRRFSTGFQSKLPGRRKSDAKEVAWNDTKPAELGKASGTTAREPSDGAVLQWYENTRSEARDIPDPPLSPLPDLSNEQVPSEDDDSPLDEQPPAPAFEHPTNEPHVESSSGENEKKAWLRQEDELEPEECLEQIGSCTALSSSSVEHSTSMLAALPTEILVHITWYLDEYSAASLAYCNSNLSRRLGPEVYPELNHEENRDGKLKFLSAMDVKLPGHLFCYECVKYHILERTHSKRYTALRIPVACPRPYRLPSVRLTFDRQLRFPLVQAIMRADRYGPEYGLPVKRLKTNWTSQVGVWTCADEWTHKMDCLIERGHLLLKVTSSCFVEPDLTPSQQRMLLSSRDDYSANFSTCPHWTHGNALLKMARCAVKHIPSGRTVAPVSQCPACRPLRKCTECPTEYLVEAKVKEDKSHTAKFRHALIVTRWSDLGDGTSPDTSPEWYACSTEDPKWDDARWQDSAPGEGLSSKRRFETAQKHSGPARVKALRAPFEINDFGARVHDVAALPLRKQNQWASEIAQQRYLEGLDGGRQERFINRMLNRI